MPFQLFFDDTPTSPVTRQRQLDLPGILPSEPKIKPKRSKKEKERGCAVCTLNKVQGVRKILPKIKGKDILVFSQSPGVDDNEEGRELVGPAGKWWWKELKRVGISREEVDIVYAVKCFPADWSEGTYETYLKGRSPSAEEIRCCSIHTEEAFTKTKARHILVLGQVAAKALLKTRSVPENKVFWSDELEAKVYLLDHPGFFIGGYSNQTRLDQFRQTLDMLVSDRKLSSKKLSDRFAYVRSQDYRLVLNKKEALAAKAELEQYRGKRRIGTDIEDADFDGTRRIFACGFSPKAGQSFVFVFRHRDQQEADGDAVMGVAVSMLQDDGFEFAYQYGCSDVTKWREYEGKRVKGFTHDTMLSEYLRFSDRKAYGLEATAEARFGEFSGYKLINTQDLLKGAAPQFMSLPVEDKKRKAYERILTLTNINAQYKFIEKYKLFDLKQLSLDTLRVYNGADSDLTKRIEVSNKKEIPQALMQLYIDLSFLLYRMEPNGPLFDYEQCEKLRAIYPFKEQRLRRRLNKILGREDYNPGSPQQVYQALFTELGLEFPYDTEPNTRKKPLTVMGLKHKFPRIQLEWRGIAKMDSTIESYKLCADNNNGRLRTKWWATGTRTGRFSSGGSRKKKDEEGIVKVINLQNIKKDAQIKNMCVADVRWRQFYRAARVIAKNYGEGQDLQFGAALLKWIKKNLPDLKTYLLHDYGQMEVRTMAQMSGDENLKADCKKGDIHTLVGSTMTGWDPEKIANDEQTRTLTKNVHFGIMFGLAAEALYEFVLAMSPTGQQGKITREQVLEAHANYFKRYGKVKLFHDDQRAFGREHKYVETLFGMKQHLQIDDRRQQDTEEFFDENTKDRGSYWGNQAINGPVQGTAHQLLGCGEVNLVRYPKKYKALGVPPLEVHDAIAFAVNVVELKETYQLSKDLLEKESIKTMERDFPHIKWDVPIVTDAKAGLRFGCVVKLKAGFSVEQFLADWFRECRKQEIALNKELREVQEA